MALDRLLNAKKSFSGIFTRTSIAPTQPYPAKQNENDVPGCETPGPSSPVARSTRLDTSEESPTKETTSMRKGLMGSLRKQKLRSISSLRSLRSPTKTRQSDKHECFLVDSPETPKHRLNSSLLLYFEESPPDRPIFDLDRRDISSSSMIVHHSSPVPVPSSDEQIPCSPTDSSLIPAGTVPPSPAPIQKILDLDQTKVTPSSTCTPMNDPGSGTMGRPSSTKSALSDSLREAAVYFNEPLVRFPNSMSDYLPINDYFAVPVKSEDSKQTSARGDLSEMKSVENPSDYNQQRKTLVDLTNKEPNAIDADKTPEEQAQLILEKGYHARVYRRADGQCRLRIKLLAFHPKDDNDGRWDDETPFKLAVHEEEKLVSRLSAVIRETRITSPSDSALDEVFATGKFPAYLDIDPNWDVAKDSQSINHSPTEMQKRDSTWGQHTGLYDGTGYGAGSSSRPVTGVTETADVPCTRIPGAFTDHENEAPMIIRRLWDNTYPHSPDADSSVKATVADPTISAAQGQPESLLEDYEALQDMLNVRGNA